MKRTAISPGASVYDGSDASDASDALDASAVAQQVAGLWRWRLGRGSGARGRKAGRIFGMVGLRWVGWGEITLVESVRCAVSALRLCAPCTCVCSGESDMIRAVVVCSLRWRWEQDKCRVCIGRIFLGYLLFFYFL